MDDLVSSGANVMYHSDVNVLCFSLTGELRISGRWLVVDGLADRGHVEASVSCKFIYRHSGMCNVGRSRFERDNRKQYSFPNKISKRGRLQVTYHNSFIF